MQILYKFCKIYVFLVPFSTESRKSHKNLSNNAFTYKILQEFL